ncbi:hypothetical protein CLOM_g13337 [Closterium sp. NIES-68]|nr:hypothetical protein CLOM_g13337 [Closterium sp. NIES-68]
MLAVLLLRLMRVAVLLASDAVTGGDGVDRSAMSYEFAPLSSICQEESTGNNSVLYDRLTVVLTATGNPQQTLQAIRHYASAPVVQDVFVLLSDDDPLVYSTSSSDSTGGYSSAGSDGGGSSGSGGGSSSPLPLVGGQRPVVMLPLHNPSATARFHPIRSLATAPVLVIDDTMLVPPALLSTAFHRWQEAPNRLLGFLPSAHFRLTKGILKGRLAVHASLGPGGDYSIVTGGMLLHSNYLHYFSCTMKEEARRYLEGEEGSEGEGGGTSGGGALANPAARACADVAMNMLVTHLSDLSPLTVYDSTQEVQGPFPMPPAPAMGKCLNDLSIHMGFMPLKNTIDAVTVMHKDSYIYEPKLRVAPIPPVFSPILNGSLLSTLLHLIPRRYRRFLPALEASNPLVLAIPSAAAPKHAVCLRLAPASAQDHEPAVQLSLSEAISSPLHALHLSGTTVLAFTQPADTRTSTDRRYSQQDLHARTNWGGSEEVPGFDDPLAVLHLASRLADWRRSEGCFAPSRLVLFRGDRLQSTLRHSSPWASLLLTSTLGDAAFPPFKLPPITSTTTSSNSAESMVISSTVTDGGAPPVVCFDRVVLLRDPVSPVVHSHGGEDGYGTGSDRSSMGGGVDGASGGSMEEGQGRGQGRVLNCERRVAVIRSALHHTCSLQAPVSSSLTIFIAGSDAIWRQHMPPALHPANLTAALQKECSRARLPCEVLRAQGDDACADQVPAWIQADLVLLPWVAAPSNNSTASITKKDKKLQEKEELELHYRPELFQYFVLLRRGSALAHLYPPRTPKLPLQFAQKRLGCFGVSYSQLPVGVGSSAGFQGILKWTRERLVEWKRREGEGDEGRSERRGDREEVIEYSCVNRELGHVGVQQDEDETLWGMDENETDEKT